MDPTTNEPHFTNCTRDFIGTHDYIFYSGIFLNSSSTSFVCFSYRDSDWCFYLPVADSLTVESLLELVDEESLRKDTALPSPEWSSDHIALLAEFRCKSRTRR